MRRYTASEIMALNPCDEYPRERVEALIGDGKTAREIASMDIPVDDRLWALIGLATPRTARLFAARCATDALILAQECTGELADVRSWNAVAVAIMHANGDATHEQLAAAWAATMDAWAATRDAWAATRAAWVAAWAAWVAARAATRDAANGALGATRAARATACERYLGWLVEMMEVTP